MVMAFILIVAATGLTITPASTGKPAYVDQLPDDRKEESCGACHLPDDGEGGIMVDVHQICTTCHFVSTGESLKLTAVPAVENGTPVVDGELEAAWSFSQITNLKLSGGVEQGTPVTLGNGWESTVAMRAIFTPQKLYLSFQWEDNDRNHKLEAWQQDPDTGAWMLPEWRNMGQDKLALLWETSSPTAGFMEYGCLSTCHLLREEASGTVSSPLKYTSHSGEYLDMWVWMAGVTDPFAQAEDQFVNSSRTDPDGGRFPDGAPTDTPGYVPNLRILNNGTADVQVPWYVDLDPEDETDGLSLTREEVQTKTTVVPIVAVDTQGDLYYQVEGQDFKVPDNVYKPSYIIAPFEADRGEVKAKGEWDNGRWTLEVSRNLTTDNPQDVQFTDLNHYYLFGLAVSDNAGQGHAYHPEAFQLSFQITDPKLAEEVENTDWLWASLSAGFFAAMAVMLIIGLVARTTAMTGQPLPDGGSRAADGGRSGTEPDERPEPAGDETDGPDEEDPVDPDDDPVHQE